jgi:hypothetical protein
MEENGFTTATKSSQNNGVRFGALLQTMNCKNKKHRMKKSESSNWVEIEEEKEGL